MFHTGSNDTTFRDDYRCTLRCRILRGSFEETAPRKTAENTAKHRGGGVGSVVANHRGGGESLMVVTTLISTALLVAFFFFWARNEKRKMKNTHSARNKIAETIKNCHFRCQKRNEFRSVSRHYKCLAVTHL